jgi:hypothetical protein
MVPDSASANAASRPGGYPGKPRPESPLRRSPSWQWFPPSLLAPSASSCTLAGGGPRSRDPPFPPTPSAILTFLLSKGMSRAHDLGSSQV